MEVGRVMIFRGLKGLAFFAMETYLALRARWLNDSNCQRTLHIIVHCLFQGLQGVQVALQGRCTRQKVNGIDGMGTVWGPWPWVLGTSEELRLTLGRLGDRQYSSVG